MFCLDFTTFEYFKFDLILKKMCQKFSINFWGKKYKNICNENDGECGSTYCEWAVLVPYPECQIHLLDLDYNTT